MTLLKTRSLRCLLSDVHCFYYFVTIPTKIVAVSSSLTIFLASASSNNKYPSSTSLQFRIKFILALSYLSNRTTVTVIFIFFNGRDVFLV